MKKNEDFLYAMGFVAAFALVMVTPAFAEKVISHTTTTQSIAAPAPSTETTTTTSTKADGSVQTVKVTKTVQPTTNVTTYRFVDDDRTLMRRYLLEEFPPSCDDGLLDYNGDCLATSEYNKVKRTYIIGQPLPTSVNMLPLSTTLSTRLDPAPEGYFYTLLDRDVLLVNQADKRVVDAVSYYSVD